MHVKMPASSLIYPDVVVDAQMVADELSVRVRLRVDVDADAITDVVLSTGGAILSILTPPQLSLALLPVVALARCSLSDSLHCVGLPRLPEVTVRKILLELGNVGAEEIEVDVELSRARIIGSSTSAKLTGELEIDSVLWEQCKNLKLLIGGEAGPCTGSEQHVEDVSLLETAV